MILTCPDCATSYFVDDDRVPPQGRLVKCSSCGNRWRAKPEGAPEPEPGSPSLRPTPDVVADVRVVRPEVTDDLDVIGPVGKARAKAKPDRKPAVALIAGLVGAVGLVAGLGAIIVMRQALVEAAPVVAPVFEAVGLKVDTLGLSIEDVTSKAVMQGGRAVLEITGVIYNRTKAEVGTPPIRISLLGKDGVVVAGMLARPLNARVPAGARRYFAVSFPNPPKGSHELEITFDPVPTNAGADHHAEPVAQPAPAAVEAKPLPADSPDALTPHESH
jgi:predicted Zn finger-like uncharacterized protein